MIGSFDGWVSLARFYMNVNSVISGILILITTEVVFPRMKNINVEKAS
jgi:hypothetical protein